MTVLSLRTVASYFLTMITHIFSMQLGNSHFGFSRIDHIVIQQTTIISVIGESMPYTTTE